jgi:hypothetical protein
MTDFREQADLGQWDESGLGRMLGAAAAITPVGERIARVSATFLGVPYKESTLVGSTDTPEELVIRLDAVDCFTYVDYVEAMRLSRSFEGFKEQLRDVRYRNGVVDYFTRNHFFTDWTESLRVVDVTAEVGGPHARRGEKILNRKDDGSPFLAGIPEKKKRIVYVPAESLDKAVMGRLETGDYVGIYTETEGLDVSHVGIAVRKEDQSFFFRHASLVEKKVIEQSLRYYLSGKPGIVVLRPLQEPGGMLL